MIHLNLFNFLLMDVNSFSRQICIEQLLCTWHILAAEDVAVNDADKTPTSWKFTQRERKLVSM